MENRREQKETKIERIPNPATPDHSVASYDTQGSYGEHFLLTPPAQSAGLSLSLSVYNSLSLSLSLSLLLSCYLSLSLSLSLTNSFLKTLHIETDLGPFPNDGDNLFPKYQGSHLL